MLANPGPHQSMKWYYSTTSRETVSLLLSAKPFTKSEGTCHIKLSILPEPGPLPQSQFLPDGPRMTCPDEVLW